MTTDNEGNRDREMSAMSPQEQLEFLERLERAHEKFMRAGVKKTGYNKFQKYNYFTLDDIVPVADKVLKEEGFLITFGETDDYRRCARVIDRRNPNRVMVFKGIMVPKKSPETDDEVKMAGKINTYSRRYLYMDILNICETDEVDESSSVATTFKPHASYTPTASAASAPVTNSDNEVTEAQKQHLRGLYAECKRNNLCADTMSEINKKTQKGESFTLVDYYRWCTTMEFVINKHKQNKNI